MHKINCSTLLTLFISTIFLVILVATPSFAKTLLKYVWEADSQTRGGKIVSCFLGLDTLTYGATTSDPDDLSRTLIRTGLSLTLIEVSNQIGIGFLIKVTGTRILEDLTMHTIPIHYAWVKNSKGSTATQITKLETKPDKYFLGRLPGYDGVALFSQIFHGIFTDGLEVGWQESPGQLDLVLKVNDPPSLKTHETFVSCFNQLEERLRTQK